MVPSMDFSIWGFFPTWTDNLGILPNMDRLFGDSSQHGPLNLGILPNMDRLLGDSSQHGLLNLGMLPNMNLIGPMLANIMSHRESRNTSLYDVHAFHWAFHWSMNQ